jgi:molybdate transport system regulatory protein
MECRSRFSISLIVMTGHAIASGEDDTMARDTMLNVRVRLRCGNEIAMGPGKADLLEAIAREGSISAAGRAMGMSYRRTWMLVDTMNRCWNEPLVVTAAGGSHGGGARITALGTQILRSYRDLQARILAATACDALDLLESHILAEPKAGGTD